MGAWGVHAALLITLLYKKRLNKAESPIFVLLCVLCFSDNFLDFNIYHVNYSRTSIARTPMARLPWLIRTRF